MRLHEIQLVNRLAELSAAGQRNALGGLRLMQGIGDDCAVFTSSGAHDLLVTTDLFMEEIHFRRKWQSARSVGHKVLTRGLSDIAAMGGKPRLAFLSIALPRRTTQDWIDDFLSGFLALARKYSVTLAGGDTGSSPHGFMADIVVVGEVPRGKALLRSGARPGDEVWVTGRLGGAAAELATLRKTRQTRLLRRARSPEQASPYFYPQARLEIGEYLRTRKLASAMMDITDGLSIDLFRLTKSSGVGAAIEERAIPRAKPATVQNALHGGDDFELLFTVPSNKTGKIPRELDGVPLTRIGAVIRKGSLRLVRKGRQIPLPVRGYQHF